MLGAPALSKEKKLVWTQSPFLSANKALFLCPVLKGPLPADHHRKIEAVS